MKYCLNVEIRPNPERRDEFIACMLANQAGTLNRDIEPGNIHYFFGENANEPNVFHVQEQFVNKDAFLFHTKTPHFAAWQVYASSENAFVSPPSVQFFEVK